MTTRQAEFIMWVLISILIFATLLVLAASLWGNEQPSARYRYWEEGGRMYKTLDREPVIFYFQKGSPRSFTVLGAPPKRVWFKTRREAINYAKRFEHAPKFVELTPGVKLQVEKLQGSRGYSPK